MSTGITRSWASNAFCQLRVAEGPRNICSPAMARPYTRNSQGLADQPSSRPNAPNIIILHFLPKRGRTGSEWVWPGAERRARARSLHCFWFSRRRVHMTTTRLAPFICFFRVFLLSIPPALLFPNVCAYSIPVLFSPDPLPLTPPQGYGMMRC